MKYIYCLILLFSQNSFAEVEVAFFHNFLPDGTLYSLDADGEFYHAVIKTDKGWLDTTRYGVKVIEDLAWFEQKLKLAVVLKNKEIPTLTRKDYARFLPLPFDYDFIWNNPHKTYCSKLIANLLNIDPLPMKNAVIKRPNGTQILEDNIGLSPDDLFQILKKDFGFTQQEWQCQAISFQ